MNTDQTSRDELVIHNHDRIPPISRAGLAACLVLLLASALSTAAFAQALPDRGCGEGEGSGADVRVCVDEIIDEQTRSIDLLDAMTQQFGAVGALSAQEMAVSKQQLEFLRSRKDRAKQDAEETDNDEFGNFAIKSAKKTQCEFELHPKFAQGGDRTCTDQDLTENRCREVCEFSDEEKGRNKKRGRRTEENLSQVVEQNSMANDLLEQEMGAMVALASLLASAEGDPCAIVIPHPLIGVPFPPGYTLAMTQLNNVTVTIDQITHNFCQQDYPPGFNASIPCAVSSALAGVAQGLSLFITTVNGNFTSATVDATLECSKAIKSDVGDLNGDMEQLKRDMIEVKMLLGDINDLLNTPQGRREGFPTN